jgi:hypothetical protein
MRLRSDKQTEQETYLLASRLQEFKRLSIRDRAQSDMFPTE